jgi:hypothetical protein
LSQFPSSWPWAFGRTDVFALTIIPNLRRFVGDILFSKVQKGEDAKGSEHRESDG